MLIDFWRTPGAWLTICSFGCATMNEPISTDSSGTSEGANTCLLDRVCDGGAVEAIGGDLSEDGCLIADPTCCVDDDVFISGIGTECTLSALRDAVPGEVRLLVWDSAGAFSVDHIVYVRADRTAEVARSISMPAEAASWDTMRVTLKSPDFFESCLQAYAEGRGCDVTQCALHFYEPGSCGEPDVCLAPMSSGPERACE